MTLTINLTPEDAAAQIERLLAFGKRYLQLAPLDAVYARNALLELFQLEEPADDICVGDQDEIPESSVSLLAPLLDYLYAKGIMEDNTMTVRDLWDAKIMGCLMPRPSETAERFWKIAKEDGIREATADFYDFCIRADYIRMERIRKNEYWLGATAYGDLEITVNLSKPEKDPKEIAKLKNAPSSAYPKCLLCLDNVGYAGRLNHPARQNLRVIPMQLSGEPWYFQYSPYLYYNEHAIIFSGQHEPMSIDSGTFRNLLDFLDQFPHYFIGSNADLPIVGGSILNHNHFQGGRHVFPMEKAPVEQTFTHPDYPQVQGGIVKWPMSVVRLASGDRRAVHEAADGLLRHWRAYSDERVGILAFSPHSDGAVPHNTVTPIARRTSEGSYVLDLVLRNNRTDETHPDGIFHPHREHHHIKRENIGLIEVMGLAILPGRLKTELAGGKKRLMGEIPFHPDDDLPREMAKHAEWLQQLMTKYGAGLSPDQAEQAVRGEIAVKFLQVLENAGVYKRTAQGQEAFGRFLRDAGFRQESGARTE